MAYLSVAQAAEKWRVSQRRVQAYCQAGRIEGLQRFGRSWAIPHDAEKPEDPRLRRPGEDGAPGTKIPVVCRSSENGAPRYPAFSLSSTLSLPYSGLDAAVGRLPAPERFQCRAELDYLRGNFQEAKDYCATVEPSQPMFLCACSTALSAGVNTGDAALFSEVNAKLERVAQTAPHPRDRLYAQAAQAIAASSMFDAENLPAWLREGEFSSFDPGSLPMALYLHVKFLQGQRRSDAMLEAARTALLFCSNPGRITLLDIYLRTSCAAACYALGDRDGCMKWLDEALSLALPLGFVVPFSETMMAYGGLLEQCLLRSWPDYYESVALAPGEYWRRWLEFHNRFARGDITIVLSKQEYRLAQHLVAGDTYSEAAQKMQLSLGRVKNIVGSIYGKLHISRRKELESFIM